MGYDLDSATRARLQLVYPDLAVRVARTYQDMFDLHKLQLRCCQALRTWEEQAKLYAQGRTAPGNIVTHAPPGSSWHNFGAAIDSCFAGADPWLSKAKLGDHFWAEYGRLGVAHGLVWGGSWHSIQDKPHLELAYGLTLAEARGLYAHGGLKAVWAAFDQKRGVPVGQDWVGPTAKSKIVDLGPVAP